MAGSAGHPEDVLFRIAVDSRDPFMGTVFLDGDEPQRFVGWLGLLRLLGEGVGADATFPREFGELRPRREPELREDVDDVRFNCAP